MTHEDTQHALHTLHDADASVWTPTVHRRVVLSVIAILCVVLLVVVPPYISVSRYQRRVAAAISGALGRPVHFDAISLQLLPVPGLTIQNFTVSEDAAFGAEPVLRANTVTARLRLASLWRRSVEVSRISLDAPSVNLTRRPSDGRWNLQGILQQASYLRSSPTAQTRAGGAPRFPYIEATGARINVKNGVDKLPFSVRETDFALWLPQPDEWHLRLSGRPVRTDTDVSDVGLLKLEATLGRAADLQRAPLDLSASWKRTPLGEAAKLTAGYDLGWRGDATAEVTLHGTVNQAQLTTHLHLLALRRADFFPEQTMQLEARCDAVLSGFLRSARDVVCTVPTTQQTSLFGLIESTRPVPFSSEQSGAAALPGVLLLRGNITDLFDWHTIAATATLTAASPEYALAWMRLYSQRIPRTAAVNGTINLTASTAARGAPEHQWTGTLTCECVFPETSFLNDRTSTQRIASVPQDSSNPANAVAQTSPWLITVQHGGTGTTAAADVLEVSAIVLNQANRGGTDPAGQVRPAAQAISGTVTPKGYMLIYDSPNTVQRVADLLPPLSDNLPADSTGELQAQHTWSSAQTWTANAPVIRTTRRHKQH